MELGGVDGTLWCRPTESSVFVAVLALVTDAPLS